MVNDSIFEFIGDLLAQKIHKKIFQENDIQYWMLLVISAPNPLPGNPIDYTAFLNVSGNLQGNRRGSAGQSHG
jgi:hypothetical protein